MQEEDIFGKELRREFIVFNSILVYFKLLNTIHFILLDIRVRFVREATNLVPRVLRLLGQQFGRQERLWGNGIFSPEIWGSGCCTHA